ncbi:MAG TPA: hypothetical protein VIC26_11495 [Marinagarivorans sp.]
MTQLKSIKLAKYRRQRGDFLIEAMIGVLLMGVVGAGVSFVTSRVAVSQKDMAMQEIIIGELRGMLLSQGTGIDLCNSTPSIYPPNQEALRIKVTCKKDAVASVAGVDIPDIQTPIVLTVNSGSLGRITVGGVEPPSNGS